jgi:hypothetical protein
MAKLRLLTGLLALVLVASWAGAVGAMTTVDVYALTASIASPLDTGVQVNVGDWLTITVDPNQKWDLGVGNSIPFSRICNADGLPDYGNPNINGYPFLYGTMVGTIDSSYYFAVGTNFGTQQVTQTGTLKLMCWDSEYSDNGGFITATINAVPIPPTALLLGSGLAGLGLLRFRKKA